MGMERTVRKLCKKRSSHRNNQLSLQIQMITIGDLLCIRFIDTDTKIVVYLEKSIIFQGKYTEVTNSI